MHMLLYAHMHEGQRKKTDIRLYHSPAPSLQTVSLLLNLEPGWEPAVTGVTGMRGHIISGPQTCTGSTFTH